MENINITQLNRLLDRMTEIANSVQRNEMPEHEGFERILENIRLTGRNILD